jgi:hypothetical protein
MSHHMNPILAVYRSFALLYATRLNGDLVWRAALW